MPEIKKLVVLDKNEFNEQQKQELKGLAQEVLIFEDLPKDEAEAMKRIGNADALLVCWHSLSEKAIDALPSLKYLGVVATGFEWLAASYASKKGIAVTNVQNYSTNSVAGFILKQLEKLNFNGKVLGIIGLGHIGSKVAELASKKGLKVIYWNRTPKKSSFEPVAFDEVFKKADAIVLQASCNAGTVGIVKNKNLNSLKEGAVIADVVSPKLFESEDYLAKLVAKKKLRLVLDFEEKGILARLADSNKNVLFTENIAWKSPESIFNLHQIAVENLKAFIAGKLQNRI